MDTLRCSAGQVVWLAVMWLQLSAGDLQCMSGQGPSTCWLVLIEVDSEVGSVGDSNARKL